MIPFEIHITGEKNILDYFKTKKIPNIIIDLLTPENTVLRTEYMSSFVIKKESLGECIDYVTELINNIQWKIYRVKIETPFIKKFINMSLYIESHFIPENTYEYPISKNVLTNKHMATDREYDKNKYLDFISKRLGFQELELCVYDTFKEEDFDWFNLYKK